VRGAIRAGLLEQTLVIFSSSTASTINFLRQVNHTLTSPTASYNNTMRRNQYQRVVGVLLLCQRVQARSWTEIVPLHDPAPTDPSAMAFLKESDPLVAYTPAPTISPTTPSPTRKPTSYLASTLPSQPTQAPSESVQIQSTSPPTKAPSNVPSTTAPTPAIALYPPFSPLHPDPSYFNYDTRRLSQYGPGFPSLQDINGVPIMGYNNNAWANVANPPYSYWEEFTNNGFGPWKGILQNRDVLRNMCGRVGMQSPIDIRQSAGAVCKEHHQIRTRVRVCTMDI
jgi:hypothetical protein